MDQIHNAVLSIAEQCLMNGRTVAAICAATAGLARVGLLDHKYHTGNDLEFLKMVCPAYVGKKYYRKEPAVSDDNLITASGTEPVEFTAHVLKKLDVFTPEVSESWYQLNITHKPEYFFDLMGQIDK